MIWPSFFAASIRAGVIGSAGGASAITRVENAAPASRTPEPLSTSRRDILGFFIGSFYPYVLARLGTPQAIFYSYNAARVYRRQLIALAARLDRQIWPTNSPIKTKTRDSGD